MQRKRWTVRVVTPQPDGTYIDRTVTAVIGGGRPCRTVNEVVHGTYRRVGCVTPEALEDGFKPSPHDAVYIDPMDFTVHLLKRIR